MLGSELLRPETVRFSMIQVPYGPDAASRTKARELGNSLIREIGSNPSKFDEVSARSVTPNSGYQAGDAGYLPRIQEAREVFGQEFMNIAFSLKQGQVSSLIEGNQGFQIIKITENYSQKIMELDDVYPLGSKTTVRDFISQKLLSQKQQNAYVQASQEEISKLRTGKTVQIFEDVLNW